MGQFIVVSVITGILILIACGISHVYHQKVLEDEWWDRLKKITFHIWKILNVTMMTMNHNHKVTGISWCPEMQLGKQFGADKDWLPWNDLKVKFGDIRVFLIMDKAQYDQFNSDSERWSTQ